MWVGMTMASSPVRAADQHRCALMQCDTCNNGLGASHTWYSCGWLSAAGPSRPTLFRRAPPCCTGGSATVAAAGRGVTISPAGGGAYVRTQSFTHRCGGDRASADDVVAAARPLACAGGARARAFQRGPRPACAAPSEWGLRATPVHTHTSSPPPPVAARCCGPPLIIVARGR